MKPKTCLDDYINHEVLEYQDSFEWRAKYSGSNLPACPRQVMLCELEGGRTVHKPFSMSYNVAVGQAIHTVLQNIWVKQEKLWGNFKCTNPDCGMSFKNTRISKCLRCHSEVTYEELYFDKNKYAISGYCDGVMWNEKLRGYVVVELKSRNHNIIQQYRDEDKEPYLSDLYQVSSYATLLAHEFHLPIVGRYILWIGKPRPKPFKSWFYEGLGEDLYEEQKNEKELMLKQLSEGKVENVKGLCKTVKDKPDCPYRHLCFSEDRDQQIRKKYQMYLKGEKV